MQERGIRLIPFFKKPYKIKRFGKEKIVNGCPTAGYADIYPVLLDVQEQDDIMIAEDNGKRTPETLAVFGQFPFVAAQSPDTKGDLLLYKGHWYECKSCTEHNNTLLKHRHAVFSLDPNGGEHYEF